MTASKTEWFWEWAEREAEKRGLSWYKIEQIAGLSNAAISKRARERLPPTQVTCEALAFAFGLDKETVLDEAGIIRLERKLDHNTEVALHLFRNLSSEEQDRILAIMRAFATMEELKDSTKGE